MLDETFIVEPKRDGCVRQIACGESTFSASQFGTALLAAALLCLFYAGTISQPFDFEDDGVFGYSASATGDISGMFSAISNRTMDDFQTNGPFRPVIWAYFEIQSLLFATSAVARHFVRLGFLFASAMTFHLLLRQLRFSTIVSFVVTLLCFTAPARASIWYRFGLTEGIAMPFVLFALLSAAKACESSRALKWDLACIACTMIALLTKNIFVAIFPALILLRVWHAHESLFESLKKRGGRAVWICVPVVIPVIHFIAFRSLVQAHSSYRVTTPNLMTVLSMLRTCWIASGLEFLSVGVALALIAAIWSKEGRQYLWNREQARLAVLSCLTLLAGVAIYLPVLNSNGPAGRYTIPAVFGIDIAMAVLLSAVLLTPSGLWRRMSLIAACIAFVGILGENLFSQRAFGARCNALWELTERMTQLPAGSQVDIQAGSMSDAEAFHLESHVAGSGRRDIKIGRPEKSLKIDSSCEHFCVTRADAASPGDFDLVNRIDIAGSADTLAAAFRKKSRRSFGVALWKRDASQASTLQAAKPGKDVSR